MSNPIGSENRRVKAKDLRIHPTAQRRLIPATLRKIRNPLDLSAIGTVHAVEYTIHGVFALWVVDGQHRIVVLQEDGYGDHAVSVHVHTDVKDDARASDLFLKLNTRGAMAAYDEFMNELNAGRPEAVGVATIAGQHRYRVERYNADGTITCVKTLKNLYAKDDGAALSNTLAVATAAWGHTSEAVEGKVIEGLGMVLSHYNGEIDKPALVKKLAKYPGGAPGVLANAKALKSVRSASLGRCVAEVVVETYNKGRRNGQVAPI